MRSDELGSAEERAKLNNGHELEVQNVKGFRYKPREDWFPIDTPLVLRLVKTHMGKCLFSPELKSYLITQWNCTTIGSCRCRKRTNGSAAELHEPMATIRANIPAETGGASGYISGRFAIGTSDFFSFSDDDFVYADPEKPTRRWHASQ